MASDGQITLTLLHDLALLYLGLAHGADGELAPAETDAIAAKLREWQPDKDPALISHVIREATLTYLNGTSSERLQEAVLTLKEMLSEHMRELILRDMADIARADGQVVVNESHFISRLAAAWDVDYENHL